MVDILQQRLANQHLSQTWCADPARLVAMLGAVQSQDYAAAKWGLGLRLQGATDADVERAFNAGAILRTHVLRPTWHLVAPADIRWMLALTAPRVKASMAYRDRVLGIAEQVVERSNAAIAAALSGGRHLTRSELDVVIRDNVVQPEDRQAIAHLLVRAELDAVICSGPRKGKQFTYALLEERVPSAAALDRDAALAELTRRYFTGHGPATLRDMAWWSGLTTSDIKRGIELNRPALWSSTEAGLNYWSAPPRADLPSAGPTAHVLPNFDEYTVAYRDRDLYYDPRRMHRHGSRIDVPFGNVIVWHGRVAGLWKRNALGPKLKIEAKWFGDPPKGGPKALSEALGRYAAFVQSPVEF